MIQFPKSNLFDKLVNYNSQINVRKISTHTDLLWVEIIIPRVIKLILI